MSKSWGEYYENTKELEPSKYLVRAIELYRPEDNIALDLGCGAGRDTRYLLEKGYTVTAVDSDPSAEFYLRNLPNQQELEFACLSFQDFDFDNYDLINSHYALPFLDESQTDRVMQRVVRAINVGGVFVGQLFGTDDAWNTPNSGMTFYSRSDVENFFLNFKHIEVEEMNEMGSLANGDSKHWHVFNIIAQK